MAIPLRNDQKLPPAPLVDLCCVVTAKPDSLEPRHEVGGDPMESDQSWVPPKAEAAEVLREVCRHGPSLDLREKIWACIAPLLSSPDTTTVEAPEEDVRTATYLNQAINNPRAKAVRAALHYALWLRRACTDQYRHEDGFRGMADLPEVQAILEEHLSGASQDSPAVHSIFGMHCPILCSVDRDWTINHLGQIFSLKGERAAHGWAAWNSYVTANRFHSEVFNVLREKYGEVIDQLSADLTGEESGFNPLATLGQHVVLACGRGLVLPDDDAGIVRQFFRNAAPPLRGRAIEFAGRSAANDKKLPDAVRQRLVALWEWYWSEFGESGASAEPKQFSPFGWWFVSGKFDDQWCLRQLAGIVEVAPLVDPAHDVLEKLAEIAASYPMRAVFITDKMVRADEFGWSFMSQKDEVKSLLRTALGSGQDEARRTALSLIDHLGRRGYLEFGELL